MSPFCAAVDWGTSSFRLWLLARDGAVLGERRSDEGMMAARGVGFGTVLQRHLGAVGAPSGLPVIVCGMAGARQGWKEASYLEAPAELGSLAGEAIAVGGSSREVRILPGVAQRDPASPDVMRGEETQLLGLLDSGVSSALVCLPGTHCKWVELRDGRIDRFSTFMTGEVFGLLATHSILRFALEGAEAADADDPAFATAAGEAFGSPADISARLFGVRAGQLLGFSSAGSAAARLSGLLIGLELAGVAQRYGHSGTIVLLASGSLTRLYRTAINLLHAAPVDTVDADEMVRRGLLRAATAIWS